MKKKTLLVIPLWETQEGELHLQDLLINEAALEGDKCEGLATDSRDKCEGLVTDSRVPGRSNGDQDV